MKMTITCKEAVRLVLGFLLLGAGCSALAQTPQDNWYIEKTWVKVGGGLSATNGGLSEPYGVAIGPDQRVYVADQAYHRIQAYLPDGTYSFSITNAGGQSIGAPRGMICDVAGNLYVSDSSSNCVYVFTGNGAFVRKIGTGTGSGNGQLSGPYDVGVARNGDIYVLEKSNCRVSVFSNNGDFIRSWGQCGELDGQLHYPISLALSMEGDVFIASGDVPWNNSSLAGVKHFDKNGVFIKKFSPGWTWTGSANLGYGPQSVRFDPSGLLHVIVSWYVKYSGSDQLVPVYQYIYQTDGTLLRQYAIQVFPGPYQAQYLFVWPCHALGPDGTMILCSQVSKQLSVSRLGLRDQYAVPRNAIPMPAVIGKEQRVNSPFVDIDYEVSDADDTNVTVGLLVFTNSSSAPSLTNLLRSPTLVEGTSSNLGPGIPANTTHRLTWNAGADWSINLGNYRVAVMAQDSRTNLLDIHYLLLRAERGMPELKISRSPLHPTDFMQVWWWLLATNDTGITLTSNRLYGAGGAHDGKLLHAAGTNTPDGRTYIYEKMRVREATSEEVQWAKQATMPAGSSLNVWPPTRSVGGRPAKVNEYGFDTGSWDTNTCKWVVPLN